MRELGSPERTYLFMARKHADQLTFRESLIKLLRQGRWTAFADESMPELANRLGVTPEVLEQAVQEHVAEREQQGKHPRQLGNRALKHDYAVIGVTMPAKLDQDWRAFCGDHGLERATLLRSLVHHFLLTPKRPRTTGDAWHYLGELFGIKVTGRFHAKTRVTQGARIALDGHADHWNVTVTGIVRGIITDTLEARRLPVGIGMIPVGGMYADAAQYPQAVSPGRRD